MKKKSILKEFLLILFIGVVGGVISFFIDRADLSSVTKSIYGILAIVIPGLFLIFNAISISVSEIYLRKAKKLFENHDEENEDELTEIENSLNTPIQFLVVTAILNLAFISGIIELTELTDVYNGFTAVIVIGTVAITLLSVFIQIIIARNYIELVKRINPEKQGDYLDKNFEMNWEESCDEGEKLIMYKSAYASFRATNICCSILWFVCLFLQITFGTGVLPVLCISAIWLTMIISYSIQSNKQSK